MAKTTIKRRKDPDIDDTFNMYNYEDTPYTPISFLLCQLFTYYTSKAVFLLSRFSIYCHHQQTKLDEFVYDGDEMGEYWK